jgi:hypothetical protein
VSDFQSGLVRRTLPVVGLLLASLAAAANEPVKAAKAEVAITPGSPRGNVFGGEESTLAFQISTTRAVKGRLVWRLAAGTATVAAGDEALEADAKAPAAVTLKLAIPPVKDGTVLHTRLTVSVVEPDRKGSVAAFEQDVWGFPHDPFAGRSAWLEMLRITLFDPKGDTGKAFTAAKVPFDEVRSLEALGEIKEGTVIVGEGVSFKDERGLAEVLQKLAEGGRSVLVLAPSGGELPVPGLAAPGDRFEDVTFRRSVVRKLDKRLDPAGWLPDGRVVASSLTVKSGEGAVAGEVVAGEAGWPWVEARTVKGKGRWLFCGLAVVAKWNDGPTPRFLFAKILEHLSDPNQESTALPTGR